MIYMQNGYHRGQMTPIKTDNPLETILSLAREIPPDDEIREIGEKEKRRLERDISRTKSENWKKTCQTELSELEKDLTEGNYTKIWKGYEYPYVISGEIEKRKEGEPLAGQYRRAKTDLKARDYGLVDFDKIDPITPQALAANLESQGIEAVVYHTPSSTPDRPHYRLIVRFSEPVTNEADYAYNIQQIERMTGVKADERSYNWVQLMGTPTKKPGADEIYHANKGGRAWTVEPAPKQPAPDVREGTTPAGADAGIYQRIMSGETFYESQGEGRDTSMFKFACALQEKGYDRAAVELMCLAVDQRQFSPPLGEGIVLQKVASAWKYRKEDPEAEPELTYDEYLQTSAAGQIQAFTDEIIESMDKPPTLTGYAALDHLLDGGLYEGLYTIGAISSLGKTTFILQAADHIAQGGRDVLMFALEQSRHELMSKSISRHTLLAALNGNGEYGDITNAKHHRDITDGKRWKKYNDMDRKIIQKAIDDYAEYAGHIYIMYGLGNISGATVREGVERHIKITGNSPVVIIDYLQIMKAMPDSRAGITDKMKIDDNVFALKQLSRDYKIPVIAISSLNRESYSDPVTLKAFKESGAIEYTSEIIIGLQLQGIGPKDFDVEKAINEVPRLIELKILKNRNAPRGGVLYEFYGEHNYFKEKWTL